MATRLAIIVGVVALALIISISGNVYLLVSLQQTQQHTASRSKLTNTVTKDETQTVIEPVSTTTTSTVTSTETVHEYPSSASAINQSLGVELDLSLNTTVIVDSLPNSTWLNVTISDYNLLRQGNNLTTGGNVPLASLGEVFPCLAVPFGIGIYKGYYSSANISEASPLPLYQGFYSCPEGSTHRSYYLFQPSNYSVPITGSIPISGYCCRSYLYPYSSFSSYWNPFLPGTYTLAAGDIWGNLAIVHFVAVNSIPNSSQIAAQRLTHIIGVQKTIEYAPCATSYCSVDYTYEVETSYTGNESWQLNPLNFILLTNNESIQYQSLLPFSNQASPNPVVLGPDTHALENITFSVPYGQSPRALDYNVSSQSLYISTSFFPPPSSWISAITGPVSVSFVNMNTNKTVLGLLAQATIFNSTSSGFYGGERVLVSIDLENISANSSSISIASVTAAGGIQVISTDPSLPTTLGANPLYLSIWVSPPTNSSYSGALDLTIVVG